MQSLPHSERLLEQLRKQLEAGCFCDCTVAIGPSWFRAHRNVLAAFSEYFSSQWQNAVEDCVTTSLDPEWVNEQVFQKLLDYVYTGYLNVDSDNVEDICKAASFLQMEEVITLCILVQEDIKPVCVGRAETSDTHEPETALPSSDTFDAFEPEEEEEEEEEEEVVAAGANEDVNNGQGDQPPTTQEEEEAQEGGEAAEETEAEVSRTRVSLRARKPKVMSDGSVLNACSVVLQRETRHLIGQPDPVGKPKPPGRSPGRSPGTRAGQVVRGDAGDPDWQKAWAAGGKDGPKEERPPKRKRGRPRKGWLKENRSHAPPADPDGREEKVVFVKGKPVCGVCGRVFSESSSVRRHMRIHRGVKPYQCQLCSKSFRQGNQLKTHMRTHTGEKPFQCDVCDKSFAQKCQVIFHRRMHHGEEKPYKCDSCGLQFATSSNFKIHIRKHSGEKPYGCDRCGKHFAQASTLTYHMRRHTGEKPYVCDTCGKAFAVSSSLHAHSRKHTGDTSCFCIVCNKTFINVEELEKHFPCAKGVKKIECDLCEKSYTGVKYLKKHKFKVHNVPEQDTAALPFPLNIPIDHQSLLSRVPPGPSTAELMTRAKAAADAEAAAATESATAAAAINQTVTEFILFQTLD